jgi:hypothetical protein
MSKPNRKYLPLNQAIDLLHQEDSWLAKMHTTSGAEWFILPRGGPVKSDDAAKILARPDICAMEDSLFPGLSQTWRMVRLRPIRAA